MPHTPTARIAVGATAALSLLAFVRQASAEFKAPLRSHRLPAA